MARVALHLLLAVCLATAGCSLLGPDHTRDDQAEQRLDAAMDAVNESETYRFGTDLTMVASSDEDTQRVDVDGTGATNLTAREQRMNTTRDGETRRSYTLNRTIYQECAERWGGWGVEEMDEDRDWLTHTPAVRQLSLLESGSLYFNGTVTRDGEEAVLLTGEPTTEALTQYQERQSRSLFGGPSVDDAAVRVWLDPETDRPLEIDVQFEVSGNDASASARVTTTYSGYGEPVSVTHHAQSAGTTYELGCPG